MKNIAIIGGGISGLTTAFYIKNENPNVKITIFEKDKTLGGKMKSIKNGGYIVEEGSNGFLSNKPDTLELVKLAKCEDILLKSSDEARIRFIYKDALHNLPETPKAFLTTKLLSFMGKLRVAMEVFIKPKMDNSDESLQDFGYRRVGKEMTDVFLDAMVAGIFASKPDAISVNSAFPAVVKLEKEYGGLFKGMLKKKKKDAGPGGVLMSFNGGVGAFIDRLEKNLDIRIYKDVGIGEVTKKDDKYLVVGREFDRLILSTPAYESAKILKEIDRDLSERLAEIEYSPLSVVALGYDNLNHDLKGFGLLTTTSSQKDVLGVLWDSSIFEDRAIGGKKLLRIMIGGQRNPKLALRSEEELIKIAIEGVKETMGIKQKPDFSIAIKHKYAIPNYKVGHSTEVKKIFEEVKKHKGLYLNSNAYFGVGLNDCVANSKKCAMQVVKELDFEK